MLLLRPPPAAAAAVAAVLVLYLTGEAVGASPRWELVATPAPTQVISEVLARPHGIGGFETGSFAKVNGTYHAYINELPNQLPWAKCSELWWDASTQLGHWTATSITGPWQRRGTVRQTPSAAQCNVSAYNFSACDLGQPPSQTWNSGGLLYGRTTLNGTAEVWSLYYGNRWSVSTVAGEDGIGGPFVDVGCMPAGSLTPGLPARPVPSYRLRNGSLRGFWQGDWPHHTEPNCTWPCHRQRLVGLTGTASSVIGAGDWEVLPTAQLGDALPLVWNELSPNVENPVVIPASLSGTSDSGDEAEEFIMVFDALSMNATCREDPDCGWVGGQCWSNTACNAIGVAWTSDGSVWEEAEHVVVQTDPASQCGLVRTPLGIVPEPELCAGCYSVLFTGWGAPNTTVTSPSSNPQATAAEARAEVRGHALPRGHCEHGDERCEVYQGYKPVCAALIRDRRAAVAVAKSSSAAASGSESGVLKTDDSAGHQTTGASPKQEPKRECAFKAVGDLLQLGRCLSCAKQCNNDVWQALTELKHGDLAPADWLRAEHKCESCAASCSNLTQLVVTGACLLGKAECHTDFCATCCGANHTCVGNDFNIECAPIGQQCICGNSSGNPNSCCTGCPHDEHSCGGGHGKNTGDYCGNDFWSAACGGEKPVCCTNNVGRPKCCAKGQHCHSPLVGDNSCVTGTSHTWP